MRAQSTLRRGWAAIPAAAVFAFACSGAAAMHAPAARAESAGSFLSLSIDSIAPSTVTQTSDPILAVVATVTNTGDRTVDNIKARIERARPVTAARGLRTSLTLDEQDFDVTGKFVAEVDRLTPGQRKQFTLSAHLRSGEGAADSAQNADPSLRITQPGVYPVLVNVNGTPAYGSTARLADARFLLPVLGVPAADAAADNGSAAQALGPGSGNPVATTLLWPLADRPRRVAGQPGSATDKVELTDDDLADELAKGGRLDQLVGALEFATNPDADPGGKLAAGVCLAVDPDLLQTVASMAKGYVVAVDPANPGGATKPGTGATAAADWLARVRALAGNVCTVALPFAQTDLHAVTAVHNSDLSVSAISTPADIVDVLLQTKSVRGVSWPAAGTIDDRDGALLRSLDISTVIVGSDALRPAAAGTTKPAGAETASDAPPPVVPLADTAPGPGALVDTAAPAGGGAGTGTTSTGTGAAPGSGPLHAVAYDSSLAAALAAVGDHPQTPTITPPQLRFNVAGDSRQARLEDALGALSWSTLNPAAGAPRTQLIVPPQYWEPDNSEANAVLAQLTTLFHAGLAAPRSLSDLIAQPAGSASYQLQYLPAAHIDAPLPGLHAAVRGSAARLDALSAALVDDPQRDLTPHQFVAPLRQDLLRALTLSARTAADQNRGALDAAAHERVIGANTAINSLYGKVTVLSPGGVYTLAGAHSPLLVVARNGLPVAIRVLVKADAPADMHITDLGAVLLPPGGTRSLEIPTKVSDTRNMVVRFSLDTPEGKPLGSPISVSVRSNAYGKALAIITECAGALLLLLTGRRLWRRFRGRPDPADEGLDTTTRRRLNRYSRAKRDRARTEPPTEPTPSEGAVV